VYLTDTYLTELVTKVLATTSAGELVVESCIFHPQGGGQPADRGWVDAVEVTPVKDHDSGRVILRPVDASADSSGQSWAQQVTTRVDRPLRLRHAALHTAGHLIEAAGRSLGWELTGNNHFPGQARIEFTAGAATSPTMPEERERAAEQLRAYAAAAIDAAPAVEASTDHDGHRIVAIGDLHAAPCGGTHVHSLADLADVDLEVKVKKGRIRVSYTAKHRPAE
jgi:Ser-tRNA(Ala) deacylase AlaX